MVYWDRMGSIRILSMVYWDRMGPFESFQWSMRSLGGPLNPFNGLSGLSVVHRILSVVYGARFARPCNPFNGLWGLSVVHGIL